MKNLLKKEWWLEEIEVKYLKKQHYHFLFLALGIIAFLAGTIF